MTAVRLVEEALRVAFGAGSDLCDQTPMALRNFPMDRMAACQ